MAYNANTPASINEKFSVSQPKITANFTAIKTAWDVNHVTFDNANQGKHSYVTFPNITVDPASIPPLTSTTEVMLYATANALVFRPSDQAAGVVTNDIDFTTCLKAAEGWTRLPSGILLKWGSGTIATHSSSTSIVFNVGMPPFKHIYSTNVTANRIALGALTAVEGQIIWLSSMAITGITVSRTTFGTYINSDPVNFNWLAIGD